jgi:glycosyltransferase involved in cell wall biosynthesis
MKVSVIIPVYNTEKFIERCICSILSQTLQDFQIVIVNDMTPDDSMSIVRKYAEHDSRFLIIENRQNMGLMWTRREGYRQAAGDYFVFVDSDDYLPLNALELLYGKISEDNTDIVVGAFQGVVGNRKRTITKPKLSYGSDSLSVQKSMFCGELSHSLWGKIYRRKLFDNEYKTYPNLTQGEDGLLLYQIVEHIQHISIINAVVYFYCLNLESASYYQGHKKYKEGLISLNYLNGLLHGKNELKAFLDYSNMRTILWLLQHGCNKDFIIENLLIPDKENYFSYDFLSSHYKGFLLIYNYIIMRSRTARQAVSLMEKVKFELRKFAFKYRRIKPA